MQLSVIVPAYNEEERIAQNLLEIANTLGSFATSWEIVLVDDGSRDATHREVTKAQAQIPELRILSYPLNRGKGYALRYGASQARGDLIVFLDSDLELHPRQLPVFLEVMDRRGVDLVVGSKRHPDSKHPEASHAFPLSRRILSRLYFLLVTLMFRLPVRDTQAGLKLFRRPVLEAVLPAVRTARFAFDRDLLIHAHRAGYRMAEAPVDVRFLRRSSRLRARDVFQVWIDTVALYCRSRWPRQPRQREADPAAKSVVTHRHLRG